MALALKGVDHRIVNCNLPSQVKRYNPRGRVPVLRWDGRTVADSSDILTFLDERVPDPPLLPDDPRERAQALMLEDWADENLYFYGVWLRWVDPEGIARLKRHMLSRMPVPFRWLAPWIGQREVRKRLAGQGLGRKEPEAIRREFEEALDRLAALLGDRPWLVGDRLSRADLAVAACIDQYRLEDLTPWARGRIDAHPGLLAWVRRVHAIVPNPADPQATAPR